jgi:hypothetical protein
MLESTLIRALVRAGFFAEHQHQRGVAGQRQQDRARRSVR